MDLLKKTALLPLALLCNAIAQRGYAQEKVEAGVSRELAVYRRAHVRNPQYTLALSIPAGKGDAIGGSEVVGFDLIGPVGQLQLDFKEAPSRIAALIINGHAAAVTVQKEHLLLDGR